jgi:hypothetical protein
VRHRCGVPGDFNRSLVSEQTIRVSRGPEHHGKQTQPFLENQVFYGSALCESCLASYQAYLYGQCSAGFWKDWKVNRCESLTSLECVASPHINAGKGEM